MPDLASLMRRAHSKTRRLMRTGLDYRATLGLVLRDLWSQLRRPLPALVGKKKDVERATAFRRRWMPHYVRDIEDSVLEWQSEPGVFERGIHLTMALFSTDARLWLEIGSKGFFGVDRLGEIVRNGNQEALYAAR